MKLEIVKGVLTRKQAKEILSIPKYELDFTPGRSTAIRGEPLVKKLREMGFQPPGFTWKKWGIHDYRDYPYAFVNVYKGDYPVGFHHDSVGHFASLTLLQKGTGKLGFKPDPRPDRDGFESTGCYEGDGIASLTPLDWEVGDMLLWDREWNEQFCHGGTFSDNRATLVFRW